MKLHEWQNQRSPKPSPPPTVRIFRAEKPALVFVEPTSEDEALRRKDEVVAVIQRAQAKLSEPVQTDARGHLLTGSQHRAWRAEVNALIAAKTDELRKLKAWIIRNGKAKPSDWTLLRRVYRLLEQIADEGKTAHAEAVDNALDAIEYQVPRAFLDGEESRG